MRRERKISLLLNNNLINISKSVFTLKFRVRSNIATQNGTERVTNKKVQAHTNKYFVVIKKKVTNGPYKIDEEIPHT